MGKIQGDKIDISVIIPVFNGEENLEELYSRLTEVLTRLKKNYEIIFIDDGSIDRTFEILKDFHRSNKRIKIIKFSKNFGQFSALTAGFRNVKGRIIITMDDDFQSGLWNMPRLLEKIYSGYDIVSGWREDRRDSFFLRRIPSYLFNLIVSALIGMRVYDLGSNLKAYTKRVIEDTNRSGTFLNFLSQWRNHKIAEVAIQSNGLSKSRYNFFKLMQNALLVFSGCLGAKSYVSNYIIEENIE